MYSKQKTKTKTTDSSFNDIILTAKLILKEYDLCEYCTGRLFAKKLSLSSYKLLGKKIKHFLQVNSSKKCFICRNILSNLEYYVQKMMETSSGYEFSTFLVGAVLKPSVTDKDDLIRSKFKLRGIDSVKSDITHQIGKKFAKKTRTKVDHLRPDLTFTLNFKKDSCELQSRPLVFFGRYSKTKRGIPQKQKPCEDCHGKGCYRCNYHGISKFESVEGKIARFLYEKFQGTQTKVTWIGGEDKQSLVLGNGRPFFAKLLNPKTRTAKLSKKYVKNAITINDLKIIDQIPKSTLLFRSKIEMKILTKNKIKPSDQKLITTLKKTPIFINEKPNRPNQKFIHDIRFKKKSQNSFSLRLTVDGGIPIKRFVEGPNLRPNLSELIKNKCVCEEFDFHEIKLVK